MIYLDLTSCTLSLEMAPLGHVNWTSRRDPTWALLAFVITTLHDVTSRVIVCLSSQTVGMSSNYITLPHGLQPCTELTRRRFLYTS